MKKAILFIFLSLSIQFAQAQTDGISYQAVIIDNNEQEIPGIDISGNYLSQEEVSLKFTIIDSSENIEYQEIHATTTDRYGMVNLIIGEGESTPNSPGIFNEIEWDGTSKDLIVELSYQADDFQEFSQQPLLFVPYAFHRNITATGSLIVDQETLLNSSLTVANSSPTMLTGDLTVMGDADFQGNTQFNSITVLNESNLQGDVEIGGNTLMQNSLSVLGPTELGDDLLVLGNAQLDGNLNVYGETTVNNSFTVSNSNPSLLTGDVNVNGNTDLDGLLLVDGGATFYDNINVLGSSSLIGESFMTGQVTIDVPLGSSSNSYDNYPLRVEGSSNGIAVKSSAGTPTGSNNFVTFFDSGENPVGRIEGQIASEVYTSPQYIYDNAILVANAAAAAAALVGATTSSTICVGLGGCVTAPVPSLVISAGIGAAAAAANLVAYQIFAFENLGVTYESGSADYAEWLKRKDATETMSYGDIVSVQGGLITKTSENFERFMVISHKPAILGNMPAEEDLHLYEKVAFMGQVPVKVRGQVNVGDYIIPGGRHDGFGIGVPPSEMNLNDYEKIVGIAWSESTDPSADYVNVAIGMNQNDLLAEVKRQQSEIDDLQGQIDELRNLILNNETLSTVNQGDDKQEEEEEYRTLSAEEMHREVSREELESAFEMLRMQMVSQGVDVDQHPHYGPLFNDDVMRERVLSQMRDIVSSQREEVIDYDRSKGY
ncbi:MAG: hypothetical protein HKN45_03040 [Flavobacteriales bacterium]|nr:hypothetical protein [Flavobacteriales bacterium]